MVGGESCQGIGPPAPFLLRQLVVSASVISVILPKVRNPV